MLDFPDMSDEEWKNATPEKQDAYNHKIDLRNEYKRAYEDYQTAMSTTGPAVLALIGVPLILLLGAGLLLIIIAVIWLFLRISARSQAYQRMKDTEAALKAAMVEQI